MNLSDIVKKWLDETFKEYTFTASTNKYLGINTDAIYLNGLLFMVIFNSDAEVSCSKRYLRASDPEFFEKLREDITEFVRQYNTIIYRDVSDII